MFLEKGSTTNNADYHNIDPHTWEDREQEGLLLVRNAGEMLYRARNL